MGRAQSAYFCACVQVFTTPRDITGLQVRCSRVPRNANCAGAGLLASSRYTPKACTSVRRDKGARLVTSCHTDVASRLVDLTSCLAPCCSPCWLQGIHFRFMPDMRQVSHALQVSTRV